MRTPIRSRTGLLFVSFTIVGLACRDDCSGGGASTSTDAASASTPGDATAAQSDASSSLAMLAKADAAEPPLDPLCAALLKEEALPASALQTEDRTSPGPRMFCAASPRLAWAIRVDPPDSGRAVRQTLLVAGADGARAKLVSTIDDVEWPPVLGRRSAMWDFDGDGVPEFFTTVPVDVKTFAPAARNLVTFKAGKISPYPTGGSFLVDGVADLDGDGLGDLRVSFPLGKRTVCEPGDEGSLQIELAAHGVAGGKFSLSDDGAAGFAARKCPIMPAAELFIPSVTPTKDPRDLSLGYVTCARLRGKSADAMIAELQTACASYADATSKCSGPCRHLPDALAIAKFAPPVQAKDLPKDAGARPR